jgi:pimeloyl-ACP methyl ester carboxylesterase
LIGARHGQPPARVVALHGWRRSHVDFEAVLQGLDATAPDLPGFGAAAPPPTTWGAAAYADAVLPLTQEGPAVVLLGHSFGGKVAVMLAAAYPDNVKALILTGTPLLRPHGATPRKPTLSHRLARTLNRAGFLSDARMEARRRRTGSDDYKAATGVMRDVLVRSIAEVDDGTYKGALANLECPVHFVWGQTDTAAPLQTAREAAALLKNEPSLVILPGVGHMTPLDAPDALRRAIEQA